MNYWLLGLLGSIIVLVFSLVTGFLAAKKYITISKRFGDALFFIYFGSIAAMVFALGGAFATNFR